VTLRDQEAGPDASNFVDFPWENTETTISYSFIQPWSQFTGKHSSADLWHTDADPRTVLGADANNGKQPNYRPGKWPPVYDDMKEFANSTNHDGTGQNCMYGDGHVTFMKTPYAGIDGDNISPALPADFKGRPGDTPGALSVRPRDQFDPKINKPADWDTVLVPNKDADLDKWERRP